MKLLPSRFSTNVTASRRRVANALPAELWIQIARHLPWAIDVLHFSLASTRLRAILLPELYRTVFLFSGAWTGALEMFARRPELCAHVRRLELDLIYEAIRPGHWQEETDIDHIAMLIETASAGFLNLQTFTWCGRRLPPDPLLRALRNACPQLKNLNCLAKSICFDPESELFKFDDLTGFSLWISYDQKTSEPAPVQGIPVQLGDMLLQRCPNLDSLSIRLRSMPSITSDEFQLDRLASGVWPNLRFCHFDIELFDSEPILFWPPLSTLKRFMSVHSSITELVLVPYAISPTTFARELPSCLEPNLPLQLTYFEGLLQHVAELPNPEALKILILSNVITAESLPPVLPVLRSLTSLVELTIDFSHDVHASTAIRDIVSACPLLTSLLLKIFKTTFNSKQLEAVSAQLKLLPQLRILHLDKLYSAGGTMLKTALMLLNDMPLLQDICILNFRADNWCQRGHYLMLTDTEGKRFIAARETGWDRCYPGGKFMAQVFPRGKFSRVFRYSLERDVFGSISKRLKRIRR
ncbi:hypothetical protein K438DRAFT_374691 [Mycena galopus ATCC 62051]|nr:hypothetical protein K438DRAFT_374691 [Mycena galopus ATCC 62051]